MRYINWFTIASTLVLTTAVSIYRVLRRYTYTPPPDTTPSTNNRQLHDDLPFTSSESRTLQTSHLLNVILIGAIGVCVLHLITFLIDLLPNHMAVWDDALFFYRYAHNLQVHGQLAWNVIQGPAYGSTELLYALYVWFISLFTGLDAPQLTLQFASLSSGFAFVLLVTIMVWKLIPLDLTRKLIALFVIFLGLGVHAPSLMQHFISGMGTTFVMAYLTAYLLVIMWHIRTRSRRSTVIVALMGGMAYFVRPDLLIFSGLIVVSLFISAKNYSERRQVVRLGGIMAFVVIGELLFAQAYFESALPLPFYAKSTPLYGETWMYNLLAQDAKNQLGLFIGSNVLFLVFIVVAFAIMPSQLWRRWGAIGIALILGVILYSVYYTYFVAQLMFFQQRFYYPTLPAIIFIASGALYIVLTDVWALYGLDLHKGITWRTTSLVSVGLVAAVAFLPWQTFLQDTITTWQSSSGLFEQPPRDEWAENWSQHWFRIREFADISPRLIVATTEIGIPGVVNFDWFVLDLSGLNTTEIAHHGFSVDRLFQFYQPDLIYMPFSLYTPMRDSMLAHPTFITDYDYYTVDQIAQAGYIAGMDIAIRRSSLHYEAMTAIMNQALSASSP